MENDILIKPKKYFKFKPKKKKNEFPLYILYSSLEEEQELYELNKIKKHLQKESKTIRPTISIETLETDLKEDYWIEWWKKSLLGLYQKLWLPIKDDSQNYDIGFSGNREILKNIAQKSWFTQSQIIPMNEKWSKSTCLSLPFNNIESEELNLKTRMIRIYPNEEQKLLLRKWMGISRMIYNKTIEANKSKKLPSLSFIKAREYILEKVKKYAKKKGFLKDFKDMNSEAKRQSVNDALKAIKNGILKYGKTKEISNFKFRSKKDPTQNLHITKQCIIDNAIFVKKLDFMKTSEDFEKAKHDSRLIIKKNKQWILCLPFSKDKKEEESKIGICSLDPGNRTFQTFYSPTIAGKIGDGDKNRLFRLCLRSDKLQSKISKNHGNKKRNMIKAYHRIITRIKNLTSEIHWKAARFLCSNFETIVLPKFETQSMATKKKRKSGKGRLNNKTCRQMLTWSHFTFQQRLKSKAKEMKNNVIITTEEYTSKTCPCCGNIHQKLNSNKIFKCPKCNTTIDRDINGARNVYIRFLTKLKSNDHLRSLRWEIPPFYEQQSCF
jgi:putative transposase